jgi:hypothetical protein
VGERDAAPADGARAVEAAVGSSLPRRSPAAATPEDAAPEEVTPRGRSAAEDATSAADRPGAPDSVQGWRAVVADLYGRRAESFATAAPDRLADVYTAGSPLRAADEEHVRGLAGAGEVLRGFAPAVVAVTAVEAADGRVEMDLVDRWPGYDVVPAGGRDGPALRTVPGRPEATVRMVLLRTGEGWRIDSAQRLA